MNSLDEYDLSECRGFTLACQLLIIIPSLLCCLYTMWKIIYHKFLHNPFAFLIFSAQLCFFLIAVLDLFSKVPSNQPSQKLWCQIMGPFIYAFILVIMYLI